MDWIVYGEGWEHTSEDGGPEKVPAFGVLAVAQPDPDIGRHVLWGGDYYVWCEEHGEWDTKDWTGLVDFLAHYPGCIVRFGRGIPNEAWSEVRERAFHDERLPKKSATRKHERRPNR